MVSKKHGKMYSAEYKFQVILEVLKGVKTVGHKEVEIALLKIFWPGVHQGRENRASM